LTFKSAHLTSSDLFTPVRTFRVGESKGPASVRGDRKEEVGGGKMDWGWD